MNLLQFILFLLAFLAFGGCGQPSDKEVQQEYKKPKEEKKVVLPEKNPEHDEIYNGVVVVNLSRVYSYNDTICLYNLNGEIYSCLSKYLYNDSLKLDLKEASPQRLQEIIEIRSFYPEYDIFVADCIGKKDGKFKILVNGSVKYLPDNNMVDFKTYEDYILSNYVALTDKSPLREDKSEKAPIIPSYLESNYVPIKIKGDWLKVKCDLNCEGCNNGKYFEGWVKWREDENILIEVYYVC